MERTGGNLPDFEQLFMSRELKKDRPFHTLLLLYKGMLVNLLVSLLFYILKHARRPNSKKRRHAGHVSAAWCRVCYYSARSREVRAERGKLRTALRPVMLKHRNIPVIM